MEREIKFRCWHEGYAPISKFDKGVPPVMMHDKNPGDCLVWLSQGEPVKVMQYTGLKDRNGKRIYEGDVVKDHECEWQDDTDTVLFSGNGYWYPLVKVEEGYNAIDNYNPDRFEVIGNIYELQHLK